MAKIVEKLLQKAGDSGTYQKILALYLFFSAGQVNMLLFGATFIYMNPLFKCSTNQNLVDESIACSQISTCQITSDFTIAGYLQLYCDKQFQRSLIQSLLSIGGIFGLVLNTFIVEKKGRKFDLLLSQFFGIIGIILTIIGGQIKSVPLLCVSQIICGFSANSIIVTVFLIPSEYCQNQFRQNMMIIINYSWAVTTILIGILYYFYNWWYNYLILFVLLPMVIIFIVTFFFLVESPHYLYQRKQYQRLIDSLTKIARYNDKEFTKQQFQKLMDQQHQQDILNGQSQEEKSHQICQMHFIKLIILFSIIQVGSNLNYSGSNYYLDQIGLQYGLNCFITGSIQLIAYIILHYFVLYLPRKKSLFISYGLIVFFGLLFFIPLLRNSNTYQIIIIGINRLIGSKFIHLFLAFSFTVLIIYSLQCAQVQILAIFFSCTEIFGQVGAFLAPIIINLCIKYQVFPTIVFSILIIFLIILPLIFIRQKDQNQDIKLLNNNDIQKQQMKKL